MLKAATQSITAPGSVIENLAVDAGYEKPKPKPPPPDKAPKKIHPLVEVAMANKVADFDNVNNFLLPPKTEGENLSLERLSALSHVSDRSTGEKSKTDIDVIPAKGGDVYARSGRQSIGAHRNISSLQQSKAAAFAKAELLSALYPLGLSRAASEAVGNVLLKTAFQGIGNFPFAGQQAVMRKAIPERGAGGTKQMDGSSAIAARGPAVSGLSNIGSSVGSTIGKLSGGTIGGGSPGIGTTGRAAMSSAFTTKPGTMPPGGSTLGKAAALVNLVKHGMRKQAVLDFLRVSQDKKAALLTIGRLQKASEQERATAKLAGLMRTYELANSDGKGAMPSGPEGPVSAVLTKSKTQFASDWCNRLDPFSRKVPLARVMGRRKGNL
jgi:hypothetical protein